MNEPGQVARNRGQSEVIGPVLLIGVFAVVITVAGGLLLAGYLDDADEESPVDLDATANGTHVTVQHRGGETLATGEVTVILRRDGVESESSLDAWTQFLDDGDDWFEPAERATTTHGLDPGTVEVVVVHRSSGSRLYDETLAVNAG